MLFSNLEFADNEVLQSLVVYQCKRNTHMTDSFIKDLAFVSAYVDDFETNFRFYNEVLGLEKEWDMGDQACFFKLGENSGLYLQGGNEKVDFKYNTQRPSFVLKVESASEAYERLKTAGCRFLHKEPQQMGPEDWWFMFYDPAGNILEILGGK